MSVLPKILVELRNGLKETKSKEAAWKVIEEYCSFFGLETVHNELWLLTAAALTNDEVEEAEKAQGRQDLIFFFEYTKMLMEAVYLLYEKRREKRRK
jgi:hypothetical protein